MWAGQDEPIGTIHIAYESERFRDSDPDDPRNWQAFK